MTTAEFLQQLERCLHTLSAEERESALSYYREYLEEAGENAPSAIEALGSPQSVAGNIIAEASGGPTSDSPYNNDREPPQGFSARYGRRAAAGDYAAGFGSVSSDSPYDNDRTQNSTAYGFRYTSPEYSPPPSGTGDSRIDGGRIALTVILVLVTFPIWFTVLCLWASLVFSLAVTWLAFVFAAIGAPIQGALFLRDGMTGSGLWDIGGGILCLGLALLLWYPFLKAIIGSSKGLFILAKKMIFASLGKEEKA